jgi:hypothetical protein
MPINPHCLNHLQKLGLPIDVILVDRRGNKITDVRINNDGTATDLSTNITYDQPSALRSELLELNGPTYPRLIYKGIDPGFIE